MDITGTVTGSVSGNAGSANKVNNALSLGTHLSYDAGSTFDGSTARTINVDASTSANGQIVARDSSGNFSAGTITATLNGNITGGGIYGSAGTSYANAYQVREPGLVGAGGTGNTYYPRLGFHHSGVVASSLSMDDSGNFLFNDNPGTGYRDIYFATGHGTATSAQYADLAEKYSPDVEYEPGTVLVFGGDKEVTISTTYLDSRVAGVVSTNPGYMMNSALEGGVYIALTGRVPCKVVGKIRKGDMLVTSDIPGVATSTTTPQLGTVIGKALANYDSQEVGTIEVVVGRV